MPRLLSQISEQNPQIISRKSMDDGVVPKDWKMANVTPLFKNGSWNKAENYRPVTQIRTRWNWKRLENHQLLLDSQHSFRNKGVRSLILLFSNDTKIYGIMGSDKDRQLMQQDLDRLIDLVMWADEWFMQFNERSANQCISIIIYFVHLVHVTCKHSVN